MPATLDENIAVYDTIREHLEEEYFGKWVVFHDREFVGSYDEFEDAAEEAIIQFGRGPYLIRQVGQQPIRLPASILYGRVYAND